MGPPLAQWWDWVNFVAVRNSLIVLLMDSCLLHCIIVRSISYIIDFKMFIRVSYPTVTCCFCGFKWYQFPFCGAKKLLSLSHCYLLLLDGPNWESTCCRSPSSSPSQSALWPVSSSAGPPTMCFAGTSWCFFCAIAWPGSFRITSSWEEYRWDTTQQNSVTLYFKI